MVNADADPEVVTAQILRAAREADEEYEAQKSFNENNFSINNESLNVSNEIVSTAMEIVVPKESSHYSQETALRNMRLGIIAVILLIVAFIYYRNRF